MTLANMHAVIAPLVFAQTGLSSPPPSPGLPPLFPNFRYGNLNYAIVQEVRTSSVDIEDAHERCGLLSSSAVATIEPLAFSLIDASGCPAGNQTTVVSCTFTSSEEVVRDFVAHAAHAQEFASGAPRALQLQMSAPQKARGGPGGRDVEPRA